MHRTNCLLPFLVAIGLGLWGGGSRVAAQETAGYPRLDVPIGSTVPLQMSDKQFIKSARTENPTVATISVKVDDPRTVLVRGEHEGYTRITLTDRDNKAETFDVFVGKTGEQRRQEFLSLVRRSVPTAVVDVIPSGATVIIRGTVDEASSIQVIMSIARGLFPGAQVINGMRIGGVQMVQLEVVVADVNRSLARNMGFNFGEFGLHHFISSTVGNTSAASAGAANSPLSFAGSLLAGVTAPVGALAGAPNVALGLVNDKQGFLGFLDALRQENLVKIYAAPTLTTLSGRPANFVNGGQVPTVASSVAGANVNYLPFGTVVNVLPIVLGDGKIHLEISPNISQPQTSLSLTITGINPVSAPGFTTKSVTSAVRVEDGQTVAIGGLIQNNVNATTSKIPVLGDLPFLGTAFRTISYTETEEELLILVTPRLVDPMTCNQLPKLVPGQETRSPDDFELFLEGILEAPRGPRTVCFPGYVPAFKHSPSNALFPCAGGVGGVGGAGGACPGGCGPTTGPMPRPAGTMPATLPAGMQDSRLAPVAGQEALEGAPAIAVPMPMGPAGEAQPLDVPIAAPGQE